MKPLAILLCLAAGTARADGNLTVGNVDVTTVSRGLDAVPSWPAVVVNKDGIIVDGKAIVSIKNGDVDPSEKEGGAHGMKITRLAKLTSALVAATKPPPVGLLVVLDRATPYRLMTEVLYSTKSAGIKQFDFVAKTGTKLGVIPLSLPDKASGAVASTKAPKDEPVKMIVTMTKDKILVWSLSGTEGTLQKPKATLEPAELDKVTPTLAEIVKRRFPAKRADADRSAIVICDGATPMSTVLALITAIRTNVDGTPLFPDVLLGTGFE